MYRCVYIYYIAAIHTHTHTRTHTHTHTRTHTHFAAIYTYAAARAADENEEPELDDVIYTVTLCARQMTEEVKVSRDAPRRRHAPSACAVGMRRRHAPSACAVLRDGMLRGRTMHSACVFL